MHRGKTLLSHIDSEERKKIEKTKDFKMPNYRSGDVLDVTQFISLSEGKFNTHRGLVIGHKKRNNLRASLSLHVVEEGVNATIQVLHHSPLLAKVAIVNYGSNRNRTKLNHIPALELSKGRVKEPIKKGKNFKHRDEVGGKGPKQARAHDSMDLKGKAKRESVRLEHTEKYDKQ